MKSETLCVYPILGMLDEARKYLEGKNLPFRVTPVNEKQEKFCRDFLGSIGDVKSIPEIESISSPDISVVNRFLNEKGFDIQLEDTGNPDPMVLAMASALLLAIQWKDKAKTGTFFDESVCYKSVVMDSEDRSKIPFLVFQNEKLSSNPLAQIKTSIPGQSIFMTELDGDGDRDFLSLIAKAKMLLPFRDSGFVSVSFPKIKMDVRPEVSFLNNLRTSYDHYIGNVKQQTKFQLDEFGAKVESAVAAQMYRCMSFRNLDSKYLQIRRPFLLWIEREGLSLPLFAAKLYQDSWVR